MEIQYDKQGRMLYHPEFHENQGTKWTEVDLEYICKYHEVDHLDTLSLAVGRTKMTVASKLTDLRKSYRYEYYRNLNKHW